MMSLSNNKSETIHSGHFMISHFEADSKEDDEGIIIKELDMNNINSCMEIEKYRQADKEKLSMTIDTDLTKLFTTMAVTYSQKLTSPKWNHFKGIRLEWKDKIRLNNLIWRCWHMQFIMKNNTKKCQFASPIDVELQIKPEAIVLEGKYWKRNKTVVCAEYRKWRRYFKRNFIGNQNAIETSIDIDLSSFWAPDQDIDNICELLFSPIAFNDNRETVRADFIQPSLEPLQPSLDDFLNPKFQDYVMMDSADFFSNRLPPVPEEGSDEIFKNVDFNMMGSDQMESANLNDITNQRSQVPTILQNSNINNNNSNSNSIGQQPQQAINNSVNFSGKLFSQGIDFGQNYVDDTMNITNDLSQQMDMVLDSYANNHNTAESISPPPNNNHHMNSLSIIGKTTYPKGRSHKTNFKSFNRREPPNYDKNQPTTHQTIMYNQLMAQQSQQQNLYNPQQQQTYLNNSDNNINNQNDINNSTSLHSSPIQTTTNNYNNINNIPGLNLRPTTNQTNNNKFETNLNSLLSTQQQQQQSSRTAVTLNLLQQQQQRQQEINDTDYKSFVQQQQQQHNTTMYKINSQSPALNCYNNLSASSLPLQHQIRHNSPPHNIIEQQQQNAVTKEMFRSNSLPINASLIQIHKDETFIMPKYPGKCGKPRTRSNSMIIKQQQILPALQTATSEPMLPTSNSALLQQLLTTNKFNLHSSTNVTQLFSATATPSPVVQVQSTINSSNLISNIGNQSIFSPIQTTSTPSLSPDSILSQDSPLSPSRCGNLKYPRETTQRRAGHIHAEKKRRCNIKHGFDALHQLIPQLQQSSSAKLSKAAMLQKGAEYIKQLRNERNTNAEQMEALKRERDNLSNSLNHIQNVLPANGAPVLVQRTGRIKEMYNEYVHQRTLQNWKFWIFGLIFEPLLHSFNSTVSVASVDELKRTSQIWVDQNSLVELRPAVSNKLRYLSTTTDILSDPPSTLQEEVIKALSAYNNSNVQKP